MVWSVVRCGMGWGGMGWFGVGCLILCFWYFGGVYIHRHDAINIHIAVYNIVPQVLAFEVLQLILTLWSFDLAFMC